MIGSSRPVELPTADSTCTVCSSHLVKHISILSAFGHLTVMYSHMCYAKYIFVQRTRFCQDNVLNAGINPLNAFFQFQMASLNLLGPTFELAKQSLVQIFKDAVQKSQETEITEALFRNNCEYEKRVNDFLRIGHLCPVDAINLLLSIEGDTSMLSAIVPIGGITPEVAARTGALGRIMCLLYFADCAAQLLTYMTETELENPRTQPFLGKLWDVCQRALVVPQFDFYHVKMRMLRQMSVVFGLLARASFLSRALTQFESLLEQRTGCKEKQKDRSFVYVLYRFLRLRQTSVLQHVVRFLELLAQEGKDAASDKDSMGCWLELANNMIAQLSGLAYTSEVATILDKVTAICKEEVRSSKNPEAIRLMATISCRLGIESYQKFMTEYLLKESVLKRADMHKAVLTAFLTIIRGNNISQSNMFWEWGKWNDLYEPMIEVLWINEPEQAQGDENSFTSLFLKYLIDFQDEPTLVSDILVNLCIRDVHYFVLHTLPEFIGHFEQKKQPDVVSIFPLFECIYRLIDPNNGVVQWLDEMKIPSQEFMRMLSGSVVLLDKLTEGIQRRHTGSTTTKAFCFTTTEWRFCPELTLPVTMHSVSKAARARFNVAEARTRMLFEAAKESYFQAPVVSLDLEVYDKLTIDEQRDIKLLSFIAIFKGKQQIFIAKSLASVLISVKCPVAVYAGMWLNYIYVSVEESRFPILKMLLQKSASAANINHVFIYLQVLAKLLDLNLDFANSHELPVFAIPYVFVALANPARGNRDLALNIIERLKLIYRVADPGDKRRYLPFDSPELATQIRNQAHLRFMMNCSDIFEFQDYRDVPFVSLRVAADSNSLIVWECYLAELVKSMHFHIPLKEFCLIQSLAWGLVKTLETGIFMEKVNRSWIRLLCILALSCSCCSTDNIPGSDVYGHPFVSHILLPTVKVEMVKQNGSFIGFMASHLRSKLGFQYVHVSSFSLALHSIELRMTQSERASDNWIDACMNFYHLMMCSDIREVMPQWISRIAKVIEQIEGYFNMQTTVAVRTLRDDLEPRERRMVKYFASIVGFFSKAIAKPLSISNEGQLVWRFTYDSADPWPKTMRQKYMRHLANYALSLNGVSYKMDRLSAMCMQAIHELVTYGPILDETSQGPRIDHDIERLILEMELSGIRTLTPLLYHHLSSLLSLYIDYAYFASPTISKGFFKAIARLFFVGDPERPGPLDSVQTGDFSESDISASEEILDKYRPELICVSLMYLIEEDHLTSCSAFRMLIRLIRLSHNVKDGDAEAIDRLTEKITKISSVFFSVISANNEQTVLECVDMLCTHCQSLVNSLVSVYLDVLPKTLGQDSFMDDLHKELMIHIVNRMVRYLDSCRISTHETYLDNVIRIIPRIPAFLFGDIMTLVPQTEHTIRSLVSLLPTTGEREYVAKMLTWIAKKSVENHSQELLGKLVMILSEQFSFHTWRQLFSGEMVQSTSEQAKAFCSIALTTMNVLNEIPKSERIYDIKVFYQIFTACLVMLQDLSSGNHICELMFTILSRNGISSTVGNMLVPQRLVFWVPMYADVTNPVSVDEFIVEYQEQLKADYLKPEHMRPRSDMCKDYSEEMEIWGRCLLQWACKCRKTELSTKAARIYIHVLTCFSERKIHGFFENMSSIVNDLRVKADQDYVVAVLDIFQKMISRINEPNKRNVFKLAIVLLDIENALIRQISLNIITMYIRQFPRRKIEEIEENLATIVRKLAALLMKDGFEHSSYATIMSIFEIGFDVEQLILLFLPTLYTVFASIHLIEPFASEIPVGECKLLMEMLMYLSTLSTIDQSIGGLFKEFAESPRDQQARYFADNIIRQLFDGAEPEKFRHCANVYAMMIKAADVDHMRAVFVIAERIVSIFPEQTILFSPIAVLAATHTIQEAVAFLDFFIPTVGTLNVSADVPEESWDSVDAQMKEVLTVALQGYESHMNGWDAPHTPFGMFANMGSALEGNATSPYEQDGGRIHAKSMSQAVDQGSLFDHQIPTSQDSLDFSQDDLELDSESDDDSTSSSSSNQ